MFTMLDTLSNLNSLMTFTSDVPVLPLLRFIYFGWEWIIMALFLLRDSLLLYCTETICLELQQEKNNHVCISPLVRRLHLYVPHASPAPGRIRKSLKGVVLGSNLLDVVVTNEGQLGSNVPSHTGNVGEEEEGEDACYGAETGGSETAVSRESC